MERIEAYLFRTLALLLEYTRTPKIRILKRIRLLEDIVIAQQDLLKAIVEKEIEESGKDVVQGDED